MTDRHCRWRDDDNDLEDDGDKVDDRDDDSDEVDHLDETPPRWRPTTVSWRRTG